MKIRVPDYYEKFHCLARACPHTCCAKWEVVLDDETVREYQRVPGEFGERLRKAMQLDEDGDTCFLLDGDRCPFLDAEQLCEIHRYLGEEATSITCQEHPRFTEDYGSFRETMLIASCPEANRLLLSDSKPLTFLEWETEGAGEDCDEWLPALQDLRKCMISALQQRDLPLPKRLQNFLMLAEEAQECLDMSHPEWISELKIEKIDMDLAEEPSLFPNALHFLANLELLEDSWKTLLLQAEYNRPNEVYEEPLERIAVYGIFRYLLKAVNDGNLLGRAQLCVFMVLVVWRLTAVCDLSEALRRFSCEIEHSDSNLTALLDSFAEQFPLESFLKELQDPDFVKYVKRNCC